MNLNIQHSKFKNWLGKTHYTFLYLHNFFYISYNFVLPALIFLFFILSCKDIEHKNPQKDNILQPPKIINTQEEDTITNPNKIIKVDTSDIEKIFIKAGLVDVQKLDSNIRVRLRYATRDNFLGINMYGDFNKAYLQKPVAEKLVKAQHYLKDTFPSYNLLIWDATRPLSIQQMMWDSIKVSPKERPKYLSNPKYGSIHCFGAAVDLTIIDSTDKPLNMGTDFDSFQKIAYPILEERFLEQGKLSKEIVNNRKLLRKVMYNAGFFNIQTEWWHFNSCYRQDARKKYAIILTHKLPPQERLFAESTPEKLEKEKIIAKANGKQEKINIIFRVQIKTSMKPISVNSKIFKGLKVYRYYHEGIYKYTVGECKNLKTAHKLQLQMLNKYWKGSFVVAFNNGKRIGIKSAIELLQ